MLDAHNGHAAYYPLRRAGIGTFKQAAATTEHELLRINEIGAARVAILRGVLAAHGYQLRADDPKPMK